MRHPRCQFVYKPTQNRYKSTDFGVPLAEPDHGLNLSDHSTEETGGETIFLLAYKFRIFNVYDEIHFCVLSNTVSLKMT